MNKDQSPNLVSRAPVVAVLGHVDHGKTSLLDAVRQSNVASREAGGITQSIGASQVTTKQGKKITFIDTPGHAAFSKMRSRGANAADIAILVVAADDGVKPQTKEAIEHIKQAKVPFIVAFTKIDLPSASVEMAKGQVEQEEVFLEGRGGDTPFIEVSAKKGQGIEELLELVSLMAEVNEIKSDMEGQLQAIVIETSKDKRGPLASVVVKNGKLKVGQDISSEQITTRVRGLFNDLGKSVREVLAGEPAQILGFSELPQVGAVIRDKGAESQDNGQKINKSNRVEVNEGQIAVFVKAKTAGALEALLASMPQNIVVVGSGVGDVNESDVFFAKAANALIVTFEASVPGGVLKLAETESVQTSKFEIIYELIKFLEEKVNKGKGVVVAQAQILAIFPYENKKVAGSKISMGVFKRGQIVTIMRGEKALGEVKITSMRRQKAEISEGKQGEELGILFEPQLAFEVGDMIVSLQK